MNYLETHKLNNQEEKGLVNTIKDSVKNFIFDITTGIFEFFLDIKENGIFTRQD